MQCKVMFSYICHCVLTSAAKSIMAFWFVFHECAYQNCEFITRIPVGDDEAHSKYS